VYTGKPIDGGFRIDAASVIKWSDIDFDSGVIYLYRSKVSNDDFIPMTNRLITTLFNRRKIVEGVDITGCYRTGDIDRVLESPRSC